MRIISFTAKGNEVNLKLSQELGAEGFSIKEHENLKKISLNEFVKNGFENFEPMIFVGAVGIAVRAISKFVKDKFSDPPVVVIDEMARFVIPILSGHVGGGNELAVKISKILNADTVITTATDINKVFAVDVFAKKNNLFISERDLAKKISSALLEKENVSFYCEKKNVGELPTELEQLAGSNLGIYVGIKKNSPFKETLHLIPKVLCVGIGCRRGIKTEQIAKAVSLVFAKYKLEESAVVTFASIDIKKDEEALLEFIEGKHPIKFYTADELRNASGTFTASEFVKSITGTDNVCERSAALASGNGKIIVSKECYDGVTVAVAERNWGVSFE